MTKVWRGIVALLVIAVLAASCGDDTDDSSGATSSPSEPGTEAGEPNVGGEATMLVWNEIASVDANLNSPSSGASGTRDFALYGALIVQPAGSTELEPMIAESLTVDETHRVWTLKIRDGVKFSDGTPFNAEAVKVNWERIQTPEVRSPAYSYTRAIASLTVTDPLTLQIELVEPNVVFDRVVSRSALNYIASAEAIKSGHDLKSDPIGAGPFLLESWVRDDRMVLVRNPDYFDAPRPYLDRLILRVVTDEEQRVDTLLTGGADASYTTNPQTVERATESGAEFIGADVGTGTVINFNVTRPPFDDVRVRRAVTIGVDYQGLLETVQGSTAVAAYNFTADGTPWSSKDAAIGEYDFEEAARLIEEYMSDTGVSSLELPTLSGPNHIPMAEFVQTAMNQIPNVSMTIETIDQPALIQRSYAHDYGMTFWGYPTINPDPDLHQGMFGGLSTNSTGYASAEVDRLFTEARSTPDTDERNELYAQMFAVLAEDLPFRPIRHGQNGWIHNAELSMPELYTDGVPRLDLVSLR